MTSIKSFIKQQASSIKPLQWLWLSLWVLAGAAGGWLYYRYFGCDGSCAITSSPIRSAAYGALMAALGYFGVKKENQ